MQEGALKSLRVADFTWAIAGPWITTTLAAFGATVVRIESTQQVCLLRTTAPFKDRRPGLNRSCYYAFLNSNKFDMSLALKHSKGVELAKKVVAWADVVVESFTPGVMDGFGLGYEELKKIKPDIIMVSASGQGQSGPYAKNPTTGLQLVGLSGFTNLTGWPDRDPVQPFGAYTDFITPRLGVAATIAALLYRNKTKKGVRIDLSQFEAGVYFLGPALLHYFLNNQELSRQGNSSSHMVPHGVYRCKGEDRWIAIEVSSDTEWQSFCEVLGNPEWASDPKFSTVVSRKGHEVELDRLIGAHTLDFIGEELMARLQASGVSCGVVKNSQDVYEESNYNIRLQSLFWMLKHDEIGIVPHLGQVAKLSKTPAEPTLPSPCLGQHTEYVCKEILGISDEEFIGLFNDGVFGLY